MGTFASNVQVYAGSEPTKGLKERIIGILRQRLASDGYIEVEPSDEADRQITIGQGDASRWISVYDSGGDPKELANLLSASLNTFTVDIALHDSDVLVLDLFKSGELIDHYNSYPEYFEEHVSREQRRKVRGRPELWSELLMSSATEKQLRSSWDSQPLFADDILHATARLLGMDANYVIEYFPPEASHNLTHLSFRLKEIPSYRIKAEGPPRFEFASYGEAITVSEGDEFDLHLAVYNRGGSAKGMQVLVWGDALDRGLIEVNSVHVHTAETMPGIQAKFESGKGQADKSAVDLKIAHFPDLALPQGIAANTAIGGDANWRKSYEALQATSICTFTKCRALEPGNSRVFVGLVPKDNPTSGQVALEISLEIHPRSRQPLKYFREAHGNNSHYLRVLEQPRRLIGLVALGVDRDTCVEVAIHAIERWHHAIGEFGRKKSYQIVLNSGIDLRPTTKQLRADKFLTSEQWNIYKMALKACESLSGTLPSGMVDPSAPPIDNGSGFAFDATSLFFRDGTDQVSPHLGFWLDLSIPGVDASAISDTLRQILDDAMSRAAGYQAFIARWNWALSSGMNSTPYENASGVHGQCTTGRRWCSRFLRGVSEQIWLGPSLLRQVPSPESLSTTADLRRVGESLHLNLKTGATLDQLERVLEPILPSHRDWSEATRRLYPMPDRPTDGSSNAG